MREIKFRVFDKTTKQIYPVSKIVFTGLNGEAHRIYFNGIHRDIKDCELMQFTGLEDCNGKEIYEGDIVSDVHANLFTVEWNDDRCLMQLSDGSILDGHELGNVVIIGNIHEKSEQMK